MTPAKTAECLACHGVGAVPVTRVIAVAGCCGNPTRTGDCCGNAIPIPEETIEYEPCPECGGNDNA